MHFKKDRIILIAMERLKYAAAQAVVVIVIGFVVAFANNAVSVNGINPFRKVADVPLVENSHNAGTESIRIISLERMRGIVESGGLVIDARTPGEYEDGHIPSAVLFDYYEMARYLDDVLPLIVPGEEVVLYCTGPTCEDSELLARELYTMGYTNLLVFSGGFEEWVSAGLPVETGSPTL